MSRASSSQSLSNIKQLAPSYFYSEPMSFCQCMMPSQIAWEVMNQLGQSQIAHFIESNLNYHNPFIKSFKRCEQSVAKVIKIQEFIFEVQPDFKLTQPQSLKQALQQFGRMIEEKQIPGYIFLNEVQDEIQQIYQYLISQKKKLQSVKKQYTDILLQGSLLVTAANSSGKLNQLGNRNQASSPQNNSDQGIMQEQIQMKKIPQQKARSPPSSSRSPVNYNHYQHHDQKQRKTFDLSIFMDAGSAGFESKCYMIKAQSFLVLSRILFRISRGNIWIESLEIPFDQVDKIFPNGREQLTGYSVICLIFQKSSQGVLLKKVQKVMYLNEALELMVESRYWEKKLKELQNQAKQTHNIRQLTNESIERYLFKMHQSKEGSRMSRLRFLDIYVKKQRQLYKQLSCCKTSPNFIHFEIFIPTKELPLQIHPNCNLPPLIVTPKKTNHKLPSKFSTPAILQIPQQILNTYGVPSYGQYNPAITYIVTFGFFIGVMFGDVGHMLLAIPVLIYFKANIWAWSVIFWMGYCGIIYNEFFGLNLGLFSSCYDIKYGNTAVHTGGDCVYPMGVDSIWKISQNQMQYTNSLKMKLSVILGVLHMLLGLGIRFLNSFKKRDFIDIFLLTLPQTVFMMCTFVYMDFLIIYKWFQLYKGEQAAKAPSIISTMIAIYAEFGYDGGENGEGGTPIFWGNQRSFQRALVTICVLMIPIMLFGKPIAIYCCGYCKRKDKQLIVVSPSSSHENHDQNYDCGSAVVTDSPKKSNEQNRMLRDQDLEYHEHPNAYLHSINDDDNDDDQNLKNPMQQPNRQYRSQSAELFSSSSQIGSRIKQNKEDPIQFSQVIVHQFIQTIQYVLGTVSNTASYLRLWALSLAHGQLSEVIFDLILRGSILGGYPSIVPILIVFPCFLAVTFGVLICMDSMECFLHSLRLHWVEFQNKFYKGDGYEFNPFSFKQIFSQQVKKQTK